MRASTALIDYLFGDAILKVLQINNVYGNGSTGKLTQMLHTSLIKDGYESIVMYGRGQTVDETGVYRICSDNYGKMNSLFSRFTGLRYGGCWLSTKKTIKEIQKEKPDVVHLQCINGNFLNIYRLVGWLRDNNTPTVITLHAEFMYTANCGHSYECERWKRGCGACPHLYRATKSLFFDRTKESYRRMSKSFSEFDDSLSIVSVSPWLKERAKSSPIMSGKNHYVIMNGVDISVFRLRQTNGYRLREKHSINNRKVIFHATAMFSDRPDDSKGGCYVLRLAEKMCDLPVVFIVAGKHRLSEPVSDNVILLGEIKDQDLLAEYYNLADLTVLASRRETFSLICAESLCCGTPVVGFRAGAPEMISIQEYSEFVSYGDESALERCVNNWLYVKTDQLSQEISEKASEIYAKETMVQRYEELYRRMKCNK